MKSDSKVPFAENHPKLNLFLGLILFIILVLLTFGSIHFKLYPVDWTPVF